jgi:hypothetical protein
MPRIAHTHTHTHERTHRYTHRHAHTHTHNCTHRYTHNYTHSYAHTRNYAHSYAHTHNYAHSYAHTHNYTHSYAHTHNYTQLRTHTPALPHVTPSAVSLFARFLWGHHIQFKMPSAALHTYAHTLKGCAFLRHTHKNTHTNALSKQFLLIMSLPFAGSPSTLLPAVLPHTHTNCVHPQTHTDSKCVHTLLRTHSKVRAFPRIH